MYISYSRFETSAVVSIPIDRPTNWIEQSVTPKIPVWSQNVLNIIVLCDPIKRLLSDFLHVKAVHKTRANNVGRVNAKFLGPQSRLYPFE